MSSVTMTVGTVGPDEKGLHRIGGISSLAIGVAYSGDYHRPARHRCSSRLEHRRYLECCFCHDLALFVGYRLYRLSQ